MNAPRVIPAVLPSFIPYGVVVASFVAFVIYNGGIVLGKPCIHRDESSIERYLLLGDKSNHIPAFHVPQLYYFVGFATAIGWPALLSAPGGGRALAQGVWYRMFGSRRYTSQQCGLCMPLRPASALETSSVHA